MSHWLGPSATGRNREIAASSAILADFSLASAVGCAAHLLCLNLLRPSEKRTISAWQIGALLENPGDDDK
jgi:hypothetical protein